MAREIIGPEEARQKYEALPAELKALYYGDEMLAAVRAAGAKNRLHIDKIGDLEREVGFVILGLTEPKEFVESLMDTLSIEKAAAAGIAKDLSELLFSKIRDSLRQRVESATAEPELAPQAPQKEGLPDVRPSQTDPLRAISATKEKIVDTSIVPQRGSYKADPYREPVG